MNEFSIRRNRDHFQVMYGNMLISTADTEKEAEHDIENYNQMIDHYIQTGDLQSQLVAVFLR